MKILFSKYSATGNDFVVIDNRNHFVKVEDSSLWQKLCDRRFGIGADGVLLVENSNTGADFRMRYINGSDGVEAEMCGNGGRALAHYAQNILHIGNGQELNFQTHGGHYRARVRDNMVELNMTELKDCKKYSLDKFSFSVKKIFVNTGVPHAVFEVKDLEHFPVCEKGKQIRWDEMFARGTNVNFYEQLDSAHAKMRTFERGVEDETLACGTGAVALAYLNFQDHPHQGELNISVKGGDLKVKYNSEFKDVWLCGNVQLVFTGEILC